MKIVSLISSGIDSPVATYLLSKKVDEMILVHGDIRPFTDDREIDNFTHLFKHLKNIMDIPVTVYVVPHGRSLFSYKENCNNRFTCVFCKRMILRYAEKIAEKEDAAAVVLGDSLGQVASQTLQNIRVITQAVSIPVLRPLIGLDKEEVIKIAKKIGTFDFSIQPSDGCNAVPHKPATKAKLDEVLAEEMKINVSELVDDVVENSELVFI